MMEDALLLYLASINREQRAKRKKRRFLF